MATGLIEYALPEELPQGPVFPAIDPGVEGAGGFTVIANELAGLVPQTLLAVTLTFPEVDP